MTLLTLFDDTVLEIGDFINLIIDHKYNLMIIGRVYNVTLTLYSSGNCHGM